MHVERGLLQTENYFNFTDKNSALIYNQKVPATEELDSTNVIEDALVIMILATMVPSHPKMFGRKLHFISLNS